MNPSIRTDINRLFGRKEETSVAPLLQRIYENALKNTHNKSNRHDGVVKRFSLALLILIGKAGYELLQKNLGDALPAYSTLQKMLALTECLTEGRFYFDELVQHLKDWDSPMFVHIHLDDTRIKHRVEHDSHTDRFVGLVLPLRNGLPICDAFIFQTFDGIKEAFENSTVAKYAHCIVVRPVTVDAPSFVLFVLGTDSKYDHSVIMKRWNYIDQELVKRGVKVISYGSDGAGPFLKAMLTETKLFTVSRSSNVPPSWTFYLMPELKERGLYAQDDVHLLAKLCTRALGPSNIIVLGAENCVVTHLQYIFNHFGKERHGLTQQMLKNKDKQNYSKIAVLVGDDVTQCLEEVSPTIRAKGTIVYLGLMRRIRDAHFEKGISPLQRVSLLWEVVFFVRIWRCWLNERDYSEKDHFITTNAYTCIELNAHLLLNMVYNVVVGIYPTDVLRVWFTGSQSCEQLFRLLRSMTPVFSTIINFTMKGMMERIHRLNYVSSIESTDNIIFPRVKRRLLQLNEETEKTFQVPTVEDLERAIKKAKDAAIALASECKMDLDSYEDDHLNGATTELVEDAIENDLEDEDVQFDETEAEKTDLDITQVTQIKEDLAVIKLKKKKNVSLPTYIESTEKGTKSSHSYSSVNKSKKTPFVEYKGAFIHKTTALYLLQEPFQISNDRLLRVRSNQPTHLFSGLDTGQEGTSSHVNIGDLCLFRQEIDNEKVLMGRVVSFSYMEGPKRVREYSSTYVNIDEYAKRKPDDRDIGTFANWFARRVEDDVNDAELAFFEPLELVFQAGYLSMEYYIAKIHESSIVCDPDATIAIKSTSLNTILPRWREMISAHDEFHDD